MKKILTTVIILTTFGFHSYAQCPVNDSTLMGGGTANDVFYSLTNHTVSTVTNTNWHLAFSVQASGFPTNPANGVAIRVNSGYGGNLLPKGTVLAKLNGANPNNWRTIDTLGLYNLPQLLDSDSTWNLSAFTKGYNIANPYNFIWGAYNATSHNVEGTNVFVLYNSTAGWYKKILIKECSFDTLWNFVISNIDNSDSNNVQINKKAYPNKLFVYYNVLTKQVIDREPVKTAWDLLWTKYVTLVKSSMGTDFYPSVGVLSNPTVTVEQNMGKKCDEVWLSTKTSKVSPSISTIGYDWKTFNGTAYIITDTFVYFIKAQNGKTYKMTFKGYAGGSLGKSTFNFYEATTGINSTGTKNNFNIYPNPNSGFISIEADESVNEVTFTDLHGKIVLSSHNTGMLDISELANGIYVITVRTGDGVYHRRIIKE